jgi:hypothetical protein
MENSIIVCGIVRNAEKGLSRNIPVIESLCTFFCDYKIFVFENDSIDETKKLLEDWHRRDPANVIVSLNNTNSEKTIPSCGEVKCNPFYSYKRISKMVSLRNKYLDFIENNSWEADYFMVVDLDVASLNLSAILNSFNNKIKWDAVTAFGYSLSPRLHRRYHDTYALTEYGDEDNPQTEKKIKDLADKYAKMKETDGWVRVFSAYGGLAIYRYEAIKGLRYRLLRNDDERVEVRCEHYSIYKQMAERGYDKVYINPAMTLKYQETNFTIIMNSLLRRLKLIFRY